MRPVEPLSEKEKRKSKKEKEKKDKETRKLEEIGKRGSASSLAELEVRVSDDAVNQHVTVTSLPANSSDSQRLPVERTDGKSELSTVSAAAMSSQKIVEFSKETFVYSFLGVKVKKGELLGKSGGGSKSHQGYEARNACSLCKNLFFNKLFVSCG